ncbi:MAG TPA: protein translocase subunit SecD [Candidatus Saccharimonadales bacterium]|nr:protein translocase subunit SecD [Candidatus Saccharimonadales bacterium]
MKRERIFLVLIFAIVIIALVVDWPTVPIKTNFGPIKLNTVLSGPKLDTNIFGFKLQRDLDVKLGLDLQGGTDLILKADVSDIPASQKAQALNSAKDVIERRVNLFGVSEAIIQTSQVNGEYRIIVQLPGVKNVDEAKKLVGETAKLEFRAFVDPNTPAGTYPTLENTKPTGISGKDLKNASVDYPQAQNNQTQGQPVVAFELKSDAAPKFGEVTRGLIGKPLAIFLDDQVVSAPTVQSEISDKGQITGVSVEEAKRLSTELNAGALPVKKIDVVSERTVGASLGQESVHRSLIAGIVGLFVVAVFMVFFYGIPGILADCALLIYTMISLALFKGIPITLTLAGIAGFILSIGMAVDANVLIFERMREELRAGRTNNQAIEIGFSRAWNSIRDSNISSLITTLILFTFGTGQVRGFAVALGIGILVSMFTAITVTRTFLRLAYRK